MLTYLLEFLLHPAVSIFVAGALLGSFLVRKKQATTDQRQSDTQIQRFVFEGETLISANRPARQSLSVTTINAGTMALLCDRLAALFPQFRRAFRNAKQEGAQFELSDITTDGPISVQVDCKGSKTEFAVSGLPGLLADRVLIDRNVQEKTTQELETLRGTVNTSPMILWREDSLGTIDWVNAAYLSVVERTYPTDRKNWPPKRLFEGASITAPGHAATPRRSPLILPDGSTHWFDIVSYGHGNATLHYATDSSKTVAAEEALRNFMQTLTQTFASLPIGLAVFDLNRQLQLFNPALLDLTTLEADWLAARPTLSDFVNRLREKRMVPERRDFTDWRQKIAQLDQSAIDGTYSETWSLPTGQTYRVTGRPHPEGAIALLIENVSSEISLTRSFRKELELSQATFDNMQDAVAVFDADGKLALANSAYHALWDHDVTHAAGHSSILEATRQWQSLSHPTPIWGELREFICQTGDRAEWSATVELQGGGGLAGKFTPLPGGATMVSFARYEMEVIPQIPFRRLSNAAS